MKYLYGFIFTLLSPLSFALGLGEAKLESALNEPLLVSIPIIGTSDMTLAELKAKIARPAIFKQHGVERTYIHSLLRTEVIQESSSSFVIRISTHEPFKDAWINFLLDLRWPKGNVVKEVNLLIDLPKSGGASE